MFRFPFDADGFSTGAADVTGGPCSGSISDRSLPRSIGVTSREVLVDGTRRACGAGRGNWGPEEHSPVRVHHQNARVESVKWVEV